VREEAKRKEAELVKRIQEEQATLQEEEERAQQEADMRRKRHDERIRENRARLQEVRRMAEATARKEQDPQVPEAAEETVEQLREQLRVLQSKFDRIGNKDRSDQRAVQETERARKRREEEEQKRQETEAARRQQDDETARRQSAFEMARQKHRVEDQRREAEHAEAERRRQEEEDKRRRTEADEAQKRFIAEQQKLLDEANERLALRQGAGSSGQSSGTHSAVPIGEQSQPASREQSSSRSKLDELLGKSKYGSTYRSQSIPAVPTPLVDVLTAVPGMQSSSGASGLALTALVSANGTVSSPFATSASADLRHVDGGVIADSKAVEQSGAAVDPSGKHKSSFGKPARGGGGG